MSTRDNTIIVFIEGNNPLSVQSQVMVFTGITIHNTTADLLRHVKLENNYWEDGDLYYTTDFKHKTLIPPDHTILEYAKAPGNIIVFRGKGTPVRNTSLYEDSIRSLTAINPQGTLMSMPQAYSMPISTNIPKVARIASPTRSYTMPISSTVPQITVPQITIPQITVPQISQKIQPQRTQSQLTILPSVIPHNTIPQTTMPHNTIAHNTIAHNAIAQTTRVPVLPISNRCTMKNNHH